MAAKRKIPVCDRCNQELSVYDLSYANSKSQLPTLYGGVICTKCGHVECMKCKNGPPERPCSWCGFPVVAADEDEYAARKKTGRGVKKPGVAFFMKKEWAQGVLLTGLIVTLLVVGIPHYQEYKPAIEGMLHAIFYAKSPVDVEDPTKYFISRPYVPPSPRPPDGALDAGKSPSGESAAAYGKTADENICALDPDTPIYRMVSPTESWKTTSVFQNLTGEWVRVTLKDNRIIEGFVTEVHDGVIHVGRNYMTGAFAFAFTADDILTYAVFPLDQS